jgi:hypothetical protein
VVKCQRNCDRDLKIDRVSLVPVKTKKRGGVVNTQDNPIAEQASFSTEDILWAVGIWSVILTLSPVIVFYMLMVA